MRKELELQMVDRWPGWFDVDGDPRRTLMCFGFTHGDGWFDLLWRLCEQIEKVLDKDQPFEVCQVKEKFGGLRFYPMERASDAVQALIHGAEQESMKTCEICGQPGTWGGEENQQTRCVDHKVNTWHADPRSSRRRPGQAD